MTLPWTLSVYIARHFFMNILLALFGLVSVTMLVDIVELIRRAANREHVPFMIVVDMTTLKIPYMCEQLMPFAVLIGSMMALSKLTRTHELVVARAAGISVWQFLAPAMAVVMTIGVFTTSLFNPLAAALLLRYEHIEGKYLTNHPSLLAISSSGLWLRQVENDSEHHISEHIIHTLRISQSDMGFAQVMVFTFDNEGRFTERLDAENGVLEPGNLHLRHVTRSLPGLPPQLIDDVRLPTTLTLSRIQDSFASPETLSFWKLPNFITMLEHAGFSALRHRLYWHSLLASPFLMAGTVLVAAVFSLRLPRRGKLGILVVAGVVSGFLLHFFTDVIFALGAAGTLPIMLAAWAPACVVSILGSSMLLHIEDG